MDIQDVDGSTPLHLAIKSLDEKVSLRPIRHLLIKGARNDIVDRRGRLPRDYVKDLRIPREMQNELYRLLVRMYT